MVRFEVATRPRRSEMNTAESCRLRHELVPADRQAVRAIVERTGFFSPAEVDVAVELVDERLARGEASGRSPT